jgi:hypothetical protein
MEEEEVGEEGEVVAWLFVRLAWPLAAVARVSVAEHATTMWPNAATQ